MVGVNVHNKFKGKNTLEIIIYIQINIVLEKQIVFIRLLAGQACVGPMIYAIVLGTLICPNQVKF